ncbi:ABC transporter ATP-binding protein [Moraxella marmotae]|uniref:ABC transporter ATP-binding protein n=1 Tax=Moraxella marmotae TaxID=3344520 RepID=UPI0035F348AA
MTTPILQINHLYKSFDQTPVLEDICLELNAGEMLFLLGASGCGKTTLLRSIAGFESPDSGEIAVQGNIIFDKNNNVAPQARKLGYVVQEGVLFPHLTVYRNIAYGLGNGKGKTADDKQRIEAVMALTGISELANRYPHELSGGQQQRVALARAIAPNPELILLDEPFSALDEHLRQQIRDEMLTALRQSGKSAVFVTHDRDEALRYADKIAIIQAGRIVQIGSPRELYWQAKHLEVAKFIGNSLILQAKLNDDGQSANCSWGDVPVQVQSQTSAVGSLLFRPEQLNLTSRHPDDFGFTATVKQIELKACVAQIHLEAGSEMLTLEQSFAPNVQIGETVSVFVHGKGLFFGE